MANVSYRVLAMPQRIGEHSLGRHVEHDPRSRSYTYRASTTITSVDWARHVPVFDQGELGSCTGNAAAGVLGSEPFYSTLPPGTKVDESLAVSLYSLASTLDTITGSYPPSDTGSTGLAVAKAAQRRGLIAGYTHAFGLQATLQALAKGPVIIGTNWYSSFDQLGPDGIASITPDAQVEGGHEFVLHGVDVQRQVVRATNSWGTGWGVQGRFGFTFATLSRLLAEDGDVTVFTPITKPAPTPNPAPVPVVTPTPVPAPAPVVSPTASADATLLQAVQVWARVKGLQS